MTVGIYKIMNKCNNKCYIGSSIIIENRKIVHFSSLRGGYHHNKHLQSSFNKYGEENFEFFIIEECCEEVLFEKERLHIISACVLDTKYGYNKSSEPGLGSRGIRWSNESKDKLSNSLRQAYLDESRKPSTLMHSTETKYKLSNSLIKQYADGTKVAPNKGVRSNRAKPIWCPETQLCYLSIKIVAEELHMATSTVHKILQGKIKNCKGYTLQYAEPVKDKKDV